MTDRCSIPGCRAELELTYLGHGICTHHWNEFTAEDAPPDALRMVLRIEATDTATESDMAKKKTEDTIESAPAVVQVTAEPRADKAAKRSRKATAPTVASEAPAPEPVVGQPTAKKARSKKAAPAEAEQPTPPKKERPPKEELCVFALRMAEPERTKLHETAGPRGATRFARAVLVAAANQDLEGFKAALAKVGRIRA